MVLHFCSVEDIKLVMNTSSRFEALFDQTRQTVTSMFNRYTRRNLEYSANVIETFDAISLAPGQPFYIHLGFKPVDTNVPVQLTYSVDPYNTTIANVTPDANGRIVLRGPMRFGAQAIQVQYAGGFKPLMVPSDTDPNVNVQSDVMDCPPELRMAAIRQCKWMLNNLLNEGDGKKEQPNGRGSVPKEKTIEGLLVPVARELDGYRKVLMRVI